MQKLVEDQVLERLTFQVIIHLQMCARDKGG